MDKTKSRMADILKELKNDYGVSAVRGPRGVPHRLSIALKKKTAISFCCRTIRNIGPMIFRF